MRRAASLNILRMTLGLLICLVGLGAVVAGLSDLGWTRLVEGPISLAKLHAVATHLLVLVYGTGVLALGFALSSGRMNTAEEKVRLTAALYLAAWSFAFSLICVMWPRPHAEWILLGYVAAICVLLPLPLGVLTFVVAGSLHVVLKLISAVKSGLTGLPLTVLDFRIALGDPAALWDSLGLPHWSRYLTIVFVAVVALAWALAAAASAGRLVKRGSRAESGNRIARLAWIAVIGLMTYGHIEILQAKAAEDGSTWYPDRMTRLANRMGVLPFLAYSYRLERQSAGDIYRLPGDATPPSPAEVRAAVLRYIQFESPSKLQARLLPNILVVLAESTFDPGSVFRLDGEWNDALFRPGQKTVASGALRVNAVGGGTWITEFETIVGLDSRFFGYSGMYTHASLSPFVKRSFASYLRERGYRTVAFFPNQGDFYNARNAYGHYGFDRILDAGELGGLDWIDDDKAIAGRVRDALGPQPDSPFFGYVLLLENHSPHDCNGADPAGFSARFVDTSDLEPNCALNEYLRRLGSTSSAVASLLEYLAGIEARSGRPFVLLVFGDHQPYTFTDAGGVLYDFTSLRKHPDNLYTTFFHIHSSVPAQGLKCCSVTPPAVLLPTLLSAFIATSPDDVYLGLNLWLYSRCDSDAVRREFGGSMRPMKVMASDGRTEACRSAYHRALAGYRESGIFRFGGE